MYRWIIYFFILNWLSLYEVVILIALMTVFLFCSFLACSYIHAFFSGFLGEIHFFRHGKAFYIDIRYRLYRGIHLLEACWTGRYVIHWASLLLTFPYIPFICISHSPIYPGLKMISLLQLEKGNLNWWCLSMVSGKL